MAEKRRKNDNPARRHRGEPNPEIACACSCGGKLAAFDEHGRPRRYLPGHSISALAVAPGATVTAAVLEKLRSGLEEPKAIAEALGRTPNAVAVALSKLRADGLAEPYKRGRWRPQQAEERQGATLEAPPCP